MPFQHIIKHASSSQSKLVFAKVPDALENIKIDNIISGQLPEGKWVSSKKIPERCKFIGYSHQLSDEVIQTYFASRSEFYQMCNYHEILYNYSAYTGKWAVLAVS